MGGESKRRGSWKKNAAQQTKIQIYFDFFFINRKINFARSAHSNTHTHAQHTYTGPGRAAAAAAAKRERRCWSLLSQLCVALSRSLARSLGLFGALLPAPFACPVCVGVYVSMRVRACVCASIISKRLTLCYCAALLCENNWIKFKCFCCIICCAYYCYLFKLATTTTIATTTKATHTRVLKAVNKTKAAQQQQQRQQKQEHKQQESEGETERT